MIRILSWWTQLYYRTLDICLLDWTVFLETPKDKSVNTCKYETTPTVSRGHRNCAHRDCVRRKSRLTNSDVAFPIPAALEVPVGKWNHPLDFERISSAAKRLEALKAASAACFLRIHFEANSKAGLTTEATRVIFRISFRTSFSLHLVGTIGLLSLSFFLSVDLGPRRPLPPSILVSPVAPILLRR